MWYYVNSVGEWIKRREVVVGARRIRSEKQGRSVQKRNARSLEGKIVEGDRG